MMIFSSRLTKIFTLRFILLALGSLYLAFVYFAGLVKYNYPVPPGDDALRHMTEAQQISETGLVLDPEVRASTDNIIPDPPVFHVFFSAISQVTELNTVATFQIFARLMAMFVPLVAYLFARRFFGREGPALLAFLLLVFFSPQPGQIYSEGSYLNIISAHVFLVLGLLATLELLEANNRSKTIASLFAASLFFCAVYLSHPLSAIYLTLILLLMVAIAVVLGYFRSSYRALKNLGLLLAVLVVTAFPFAWQYYLGDIIRKFFIIAKSLIIHNASVNSASDALNFIPEQFRTAATIDTYLHFWGAGIFVLGLIGTLLLFRKSSADNGRYLVIAWVVALIVGSQTSVFQLPLRFARDLFLPMGILAALAVWSLVRGIRRSSGTVGVTIALLLGVMIQMLFGPANFSAALSYNGLVRVQDNDQKAISWIAANTKADDVIIGSPFIANAWGSYITVITGRTVLDGAYCQNGKIDNTYKCDVIYNPNSLEAMKYYRDQHITYVYAGHPFLCCFIWQDAVDWTFHKSLRQARYLERVFVAASPNVGTTAIYKVNREKLNQTIAEAE